MKEVMKKLGSFKEKAKQRINMFIMSVYMTIMCASVAYADVESEIKGMMDKGVNVVFNVAAGVIALGAAWKLISGIVTYVKGMNEADSRQSSEAGNGIATGLVLFAVAAAVFLLKSPINSLLAAMFTA